MHLTTLSLSLLYFTKMNTFVLTVCLVLFISTSYGQVPSQSEFVLGVTSNGFPSPSSSQYEGYTSSLKTGDISTKIEAAMYLAQILHESGGLQNRREDGCNGPNGCPGKYPESGEWRDECKGSNRPSGVSYYGRGYIQLTWCSNYVQASIALSKGTELKTEPDNVAVSDDLSWGVSGWYWKVNVHTALANTNEFGRTTKAINGHSEECQGNGKNTDNSKQRFTYYQQIFKAFKLSGTPNPVGCNY